MSLIKRFLPITLILLLTSCIFLPQNNEDNIKGIYAATSIYDYGKLYYSDIDSINFKPVSGISGILNLYYIKDRDLVLASSRDHFISSTPKLMMFYLN